MSRYFGRRQVPLVLFTQVRFCSKTRKEFNMLISAPALSLARVTLSKQWMISVVFS